jgi:hypothetical protein
LVTRQVCFNWSGDCCAFSATVLVRSCATYYVYELPKTPGCKLAYCGQTAHMGPVHIFNGHASEFFVTQGACGVGGNGDVEANAQYFCEHFYGVGWAATPGEAYGSTADASAEYVMHKNGGCPNEGEDIAGTDCAGGPCKIGKWAETLSGIRGIECELVAP